MIVGFATTSLAATVAEVHGTSAMAACLDQEPCGTDLTTDAATLLRVAAHGADPVALGLSPAIARGEGFTLELGMQSLPGPVPPSGADLVPVLPRLGFGGVGGGRTRYGGGIEASGAIPADGVDLGFSAALRGGVAFASPDQRRWVGFEADAGYGLVQGVLFDDPEGLAAEYGVEPVFQPCGYLCRDVANLLHVGLDSVLAVDVDPTAVFAVRLGGVFHYTLLAPGRDQAVWTTTTFAPRATLVGAYRFDSHLLLGAAIRTGLAHDEPRLPWMGTLSVAWRFGPAAAPPTRYTPPPTPVAPAPAPVALPPVPRIRVVEHPALQCEDGQLPTGDPPPYGLEAWCAAIDGATNRQIMDGPYLRWYDADHVEQRGQYQDDARIGTWVHYDPNGTVDTVGEFVDGVMSGTWRTYYPSGAAKSEMAFEAGRQTGESVDWSADGRRVVVGNWTLGERDGVWREYVDGQLTNERTYRMGVLQLEQRLDP